MKKREQKVIKKVIKKKASQAVWNAKLLPFLENLHSDFKAFNRVTVADLEINTKGYDQVE